MEEKNTPKANYFEELFGIDIAEDIKEKNGLKYVSWATAWKWVKTKHPDATYTEYERYPDGRYWFDDGKSGWVKVGVKVNGIEHVEHYPIMDFKNQAIPAEKIDSTAANKAKMRALAKACARHGLGLYIYQGEDLKDDGHRVTPEEKELKAARAALVKLCKEKIADGYDRDELYKVIQDANGGNKSPNAIKTVELCETVEAKINNLKKPNQKKA